MENSSYIIIVIAVAAILTFTLRALPFLVFSGRSVPNIVRYLGDVLPASIMMILVVYCLRGTTVTASPWGIPELAACLTVIVLQIWKDNMYLTIALSVFVYMFLLRMF